MPDPVLDVAGLRVRFGTLEAVRGVALQLQRGETHCVVGESGCGKSVTALSIMNLLPRGVLRRADRLRFDGQDLLGLSERAMGKLRGDRIGMIFQEPMTSLNPAFTVGSQMTEVYRRHRRGSRRKAVDRAAELLTRVGISAPGRRLGQFPHQLSGGLRQRVMIA
ncbi:MAG: ABC transporter ATP-binding protein, partial [Acetobacteraceae bacterium]|nr:ABC transporter ATP-binding protein [Acetobacteraceae bacterium]